MDLTLSWYGKILGLQQNLKLSYSSKFSYQKETQIRQLETASYDAILIQTYSNRFSKGWLCLKLSLCCGSGFDSCVLYLLGLCSGCVADSTARQVIIVV